MDKKHVETMIDNALHIGHRTQSWNPKMRKYIYGSKSGIHVFDLNKTATYLEQAVEYLKFLASSGKTVLFVSTKPQAANLIIDLAEKTQMPYVVNKWMPGLFTNFSTLKKRIKYYNDLIEEEKSGGFEKYTKKEASQKRKEIQKLDAAFGGVRGLNRLPDAVFIADVVKDKIVVTEAVRTKIPVVAIVDTNADPDGIHKIIPANDDSTKSIKYIFGTIADAMSKAKNAKSKS